MQIGDKRTEQPITMQGEIEFQGKGKARRGVLRTYTGTVCYIHPLRRYYTVEFDVFGHKFRESFICPRRYGDQGEC